MVRPLRNTANTFDMSGLSLRWWTRLVELGRSLLQKAQQGCKIRCLLNPSLTKLFLKRMRKPFRESRRNGRVLGGRTAFPQAGVRKPGIVWTGKSRKPSHGSTKSPPLCPNFEVRFSGRFSWPSDRENGRHNARRNTVVFTRADVAVSVARMLHASPLYRAIAEEFNSLWALNGPEATAPTGATNQEERTTEIARNKNPAADAHMETK